LTCCTSTDTTFENCRWSKTGVQFSESFEIDGREMFEHACAIGLEGVISKVRDIHDAVMALPPDERRDRDKVNAAVRDGLSLGPAAPCRQ